jgi:hypothetical protein
MAHVTCLAAARQGVYERAGWDIRELGLAGAPPLRVVVGGARHVTIMRALRLLGIGRAQEVVLPADGEGRMNVSALPDALATDAPTIVCAQAGEVSTGAFDDVETTVELAGAAGAWVHVDGAFGLWAAASPELAHLVAGHARADSWATDAHKWLNVPFDCGIAICAHPAAHEAAMEYAAPYLAVSDQAVARDPMGYSPEFSRRARSAPMWAAIRELGRTGVADLVGRCCAHARTLVARLGELDGCEILNDVVLNQVLFRFRRRRSHPGDPRGRPGRGRGVDEPPQRGTAARRSGSPSSAGGRPRTTCAHAGGVRAGGEGDPRRLGAPAPGLRLKPEPGRSDGYSSVGVSAARSAISDTTAGSASVVVSPSGRFSATSRRRRRMIFPERVFGSSGVKTMLAGFAIAPIFVATWLRSSSSISTEPSSPPFSVT